MAAFVHNDALENIIKESLGDEKNKVSVETIYEATNYIEGKLLNWYTGYTRNEWARGIKDVLIKMYQHDPDAFDRDIFLLNMVGKVAPDLTATDTRCMLESIKDLVLEADKILNGNMLSTIRLLLQKYK